MIYSIETDTVYIDKLEKQLSDASIIVFIANGPVPGRAFIQLLKQ